MKRFTSSVNVTGGGQSEFFSAGAEVPEWAEKVLEGHGTLDRVTADEADIKPGHDGGAEGGTVDDRQELLDQIQELQNRNGDLLQAIQLEQAKQKDGGTHPELMRLATFLDVAPEGAVEAAIQLLSAPSPKGEEPATEVNYDELKVPQLKALAEQRKVEFGSSATKPEIIAALQAADEAEESATDSAPTSNEDNGGSAE